MLHLFARAYSQLIYVGLCLRWGTFQALYERVRNHPVKVRSASPELIATICAAVDLACIWYWREVLCLQRSVATTCLLREHGVSAQLVIGAQHLPFKAHAWVEVDGRVVNDKQYMTEIYATLDRF